jgi:hypothetical protein
MPNSVDLRAFGSVLDVAYIHQLVSAESWRRFRAEGVQVSRVAHEVCEHPEGCLARVGVDPADRVSKWTKSYIYEGGKRTLTQSRGGRP